MDNAVVAAAVEAAATASTPKFYTLDLVTYQSVHGLANTTTWACLPADEFVVLSAAGTYVTKEVGDTDVALLDRSYLHPGQIVVSTSDVEGRNIGVVTGVTTVVDLVHISDGGEATTVARGVSPSGLQRVRPLSLGDYVVSGTWLGRVVEVSLDVDVVFDDGTACRVADVYSKDEPVAKVPFAYRPQANAGFYPGMGIVNSATSAFFRGSRWLKGHQQWSKGHHKVEGEVGTVSRVQMDGVLVHWIASLHCGTDKQLVQELAPPAYQDPGNLTYFCSDSSCIWGVGDRCFLGESTNSSSGTDGVGDAGSVSILDHQEKDEKHYACSDDSSSGEEHDESSSSQSGHPPTTNATPISKKKRPSHKKQPSKQAPMSTMTVSNTHTTVDVLWQDGTRQHGVPSTSINPFMIMNDDEVFPGQFVVDATVDVTGDDDVAGVAKGSTGRIGVVKSVNSKDHTVNVSWFKAACLRAEATRWEVERDDTVSAYDLDKDPDHSVFYGDVVIHLLPNRTGSTPLVQQPQAQCNKKRAPADLSWVGRVVDLHEGHVQVKWGDGSTSTVLPHEISVVNKDHYTDLQAEMGDWVGEDDDEDDDDEDDEEDDDKEDDDNASQDFGSDNMDNDLQDRTDAQNVEGGSVEGAQCSLNELDGLANTSMFQLGGFILSMIRAVVQVLVRGKWYPVNWSPPLASDLPETMQNVEAPTHVSTGTQPDHAIVGTATEAIFALVTGNDASVDGDGSTEDVVKAIDTTHVDDTSNFPRFDVVQSPPDHHYLDNMDEGSGGGKSWVKAVQKEWKILENSLPDTIYVRAFEDRMDLLRAVMVGASGTPYQDGLFFFDLHLPLSYPGEPPQVYYHSFGLRINPNLDESGTVCLSLLDTFGGEDTELWSPGTSSLLQVVVSIQALVLNDQPFYNEDGYDALVDKPEGHRNAPSYSENAYLLTLRTALHLLRRPPKGFEEFVRDHFRRRGRYVLGTCEAYLRGCVPAEKGGMDLPCSAGFRITLGNMVPRLVAAFTEIGAEGCDLCPLATDQQMEAAVAVLI